MTHAQSQQFAKTGKTGQGKDLVAIRMTSNNIEGAQPHRTGCTQHGDLLQAAHEAVIHNSTAKIGMAAVRLSMRSNTPP